MGCIDMMQNATVAGVGLGMVATMMTWGTSDVNCISGVKEYKAVQFINERQKHDYKNYVGSFDSGSNECRINSFDIIASNFKISFENCDYVKTFGDACSDLVTLKKSIVKEFGSDVQVLLEPFKFCGEKALLVNIDYAGDFDVALDKLNVVSETWFGDTDLKVSKNIFIDLVV